MTKTPSILLVDPDPKSLRVLEVSLRKAGYEVFTASSTEDAWLHTIDKPPSILITDMKLPESPSFELVELYRQEAITKNTPVLVLSEDTSFASKMRAIELGTSAFLSKPVLVREVIDKLKSVFEHQDTSAITHDQEIGLQGILSNLSLAELLQIIEAGHRSGIIHIVSDADRSGGWVIADRKATLYFSNGKLIDCELGNLSGAKALYRTLLWEDGDFKVEFTSVGRPDNILHTVQYLLLEGMRQVDEWTQILARLPTRDSRPVIDFAVLGRKFPRLPEEVRNIVHLLNGQRTIADVVDVASTSDMDLVRILHKLMDEQVLIPSSDLLDSQVLSIDDWISFGGRELEEYHHKTTNSSSDRLGEVFNENNYKSHQNHDEESLPAQFGNKVTLSRRRVAANKPSLVGDKSEAELRFAPNLYTHRVVSRMHVSFLPTLEPHRSTGVIARAYTRPLNNIGGITVSPMFEAPAGAEPANEVPLVVRAPPQQANWDEREVPGYQSHTPHSEESSRSRAGKAPGRNSVDYNALLASIDDSNEGPPQLLVISLVIVGVLGIIGALIYFGGQELVATAPKRHGMSASQAPLAPTDKLRKKTSTVPQPIAKSAPSSSAQPSAPKHAQNLKSEASSTPHPKTQNRNEDSLQQLLKSGEEAVRLNNLRIAESQFKRVLRINGAVAAGHSGLAYVYLAAEKKAAARAAARRALRFDSTNARANLVLGTIAQNEGHLLQACVRYRAYLEHGGGNMSKEIQSIIEQRCEN